MDREVLYKGWWGWIVPPKTAVGALATCYKCANKCATLAMAQWSALSTLVFYRILLAQFPSADLVFI